MSKPTIYITNFSAKSLHGPGAVWSIMALPAWYHEGAGRVATLMPQISDLQDCKEGRISFEMYRSSFVHELTRLPAGSLRPGKLNACEPRTWQLIRAVADGDTLACACKLEAAAAGRCHRVWAAEALHTSGLWRVILDGRELGAAEPAAPAQMGLFHGAEARSAP